MAARVDIHAAGRRWVEGGERIEDIAADLCIGISTLRQKLHDAGYRLSRAEVNKRSAAARTQAIKQAYADRTPPGTARPNTARAEEIWATLPSKVFEDAPCIKDQPGRLPRVETHVPRASSMANL